MKHRPGMTPEFAITLADRRLAQTDELLGWLIENHGNTDGVRHAVELIREAQRIIRSMTAL